MSKGFAHPYLIIAVLVIVGAGIAFFTGSPNLAGLVLGAKTRKENVYQNKVDGLKVTVISPKASWDLVQYVCKSRDECEKSATSGKWWATVSGAPTNDDGHEVFIEKASGWGDYTYFKVYAKSSAGVTYRTIGFSEPYYIVATSLTMPPSVVFEPIEK